MVRSAFAHLLTIGILAAMAGVLVSPVEAGEAPRTVPAGPAAAPSAAEQRAIEDYIAGITEAAARNHHSCFGDDEPDADLNADSGVTPDDLARLVDPPQS